VRDDDPVATHDLHVAATHVDRDGALDAALIAVELARQQRLEPDLVVLDLEQLSLRPSFSAKPRFAAISRKPASAFGAMIPCFQGLGAWAGAAPAAAASNAPPVISRTRTNAVI
jgi:hypothetical protein